jgi:hypothetical protein
MEKKLRWIYRLVVLVAVITCSSIYFLGSRVMFAREYTEQNWGCCVVYPEGYNPELLYRSLPDSILKTVEAGRTLFEANCASCHAIHSVVVGPALKDIHKRRSKKWLRRWVKNPKGVVESGDKYAIKLVDEYKSAGVMSSFATLTNKEIDLIIEYCKVLGEPIR